MIYGADFDVKNMSKKKKYGSKKPKIILLLMAVILLNGCGQDQVMDGDGMFQIDQDESEAQETDVAGPDGVKETYEVTDADLSGEYLEEDKLVTLVRYYEMNDGTWRTDEHTYEYRLEITGRMGGAVKDSTFVYLSNIEDISFERAYMAAGLSSNMDDYFRPEEAVLVAMK